MIAGFQIKNSDNKFKGRRSTKDFRVSGSLNKEGPWKILVEDRLNNSRSETVQLLNFTFVKPVEIQFLKFELVSYWGSHGGGLQYLAAILAPSEQKVFIYYQTITIQTAEVH